VIWQDTTVHTKPWTHLSRYVKSLSEPGLQFVSSVRYWSTSTAVGGTRFLLLGQPIVRGPNDPRACLTQDAFHPPSPRYAPLPFFALKGPRVLPLIVPTSRATGRPDWHLITRDGLREGPFCLFRYYPSLSLGGPDPGDTSRFPVSPLGPRGPRSGLGNSASYHGSAAL